ncbi:cytoskeleton protein RodZ [Oleiphilus messinensis]|uniref:Cytoskeleton protein RodZ n=1 Tax=Oleiphilus messinensis TaxID=141451 RepID=A0A1Y0I9V3_9GAMM|nr:RodZ domain-containing protein [Oleiphilus messinensis]ARU56546.1 cytoskeleton protein RodZ [Oleiphilus messinensis]
MNDQVEEHSGPEHDVGSRLRTAREARGLSVHETAEELHLRPSIVSAIEKNTFDLVPGELFLKGYVKAYARLVKLPENEVVAQLEGLLESRKQDLVGELGKKQRRPRSHNPAIFVAVILMVCGGVFWLYSKGVISINPGAFTGESDLDEQRVEVSPKIVPIHSDTTGNVEAPNVAVSGLEAEIENGEVETKTGGTRPDSDIDVTSSDDEVLGMDQNEPIGAGVVNSDTVRPTSESNPSPVQEDAPGNVVVKTQTVKTKTAKVDTVVSTDHSEASDVENSTENPRNESVAEPVAEVPVAEVPVAAGSVAESPVIAVTGIGRLVAQFSADCWIQVKNGKGRTVIAALKRDGDSIDYKGSLPFTVVIGAASAVDSMYFNGAEIDFTNYRVWNNRVQFVVGE